MFARYLVFLMMLLWCQEVWATNWCNDANIGVCSPMHINQSPILDLSVNGNNGTLYGSPTYSTNSLGSNTSGSWSFSGSNDVNYGNHTVFQSDLGSTGVISIVARVSFSSSSITTNGQRTWIVTKGNSNNYEYALFATGTGSVANLTGTIWEAGSANVMNTQGSTSLQTNTNYCVALVYNRATPVLNVYVNGVQDGTSSSATGTSGANTSNLYIGKRQDGGGTQLNGLVNEFAIFQRALLSTEVASICSNSLIGTNPSSIVQGKNFIQGTLIN